MMMQNYISRVRDWIRRHNLILMWSALALVAVGLLYWRIVRGYIPIISYVSWSTPPEWVQGLYSARWIVRGILLIALGGLGYIELSHKSLSNSLSKVLSSRCARVGVLCAFLCLIGTFVFQPGNYVTAEQRPNVSAPWVVLQNFKDGQWFIYWTNYGHLGGPFMQFHNSIYYYFAALLGIVIPDFFDVAEVAAYILVIASGWTAYLYASQIAKSPLAGMVAAIAYAGSYYQFQMYSLGANNPLGLLLVLCPFQFYWIERACDSQGKTFRLNLSLLAIIVGLQLWNHPLHGSWMVLFGAIYSAIKSLTDQELALRQRIFRLTTLVAAHGFGAMMGLYQILPQIVESDQVSSPRLSEGLGLEYILDANLATGWGGAYISYSILLAALVGGASGLYLRHRQIFASSSVIVLTLALAIVPYYFPRVLEIASAIPLAGVIFVRSTRYVMIAFGLIAALAGLCVSLLPRLLEQLRMAGVWPWALARLSPERLGLLLVAAILVENVPLTLRFNYKSPDSYLNDSTGRWPLIEMLAKTSDKTSRVFDVKEGLSPSWLYPMLTGHSSMSGHYEDAPLSFQTSRKFQMLLNENIEQGHISVETASLLYQLNVGYLITDGTDLMLPGLGLMHRSDSATLWRVPNHSPITAYSAPPLEQEGSVPGDFPVVMYEHLETSTTVRVHFSVPEPAFIQLSYSSYPYLRVSLDNELIPHETTSLGLIGFWADEGRHVVEVRPELSPLRKITLGIGAVTLTAIIALVLVWNRTT